MKRLAYALLAAALLTAPLIACAPEPGSVESPLPSAGPESAPFVLLAPEAALEMMSGGAVILDVRSREDYDSGHLRGAVSLPDGEIRDKIAALVPDKDQVILLYCQKGQKSEEAGKSLIALGYAKVFGLGGLQDWPGETVTEAQDGTETVYHKYAGGELPDAVVTPIDFSVTQSVGGGLPEFEFRLMGTRTDEYGLTPDGNRYYLAWGHTEIIGLSVTGNGLSQEFTGLAVSTPAGEAEQYGLSLEDLDSDGYSDIQVGAYTWLWDQSAGTFMEQVR